MGVVGHFVPSVPEAAVFDPPPALTVAQQRFERTSEITFPGQFVVGILSLVAMDSGDDSQWVGVIILVVAFAINTAIYVGVGFFLLALIDGCRSMTGKTRLR